jgi:hypothetical protein
MAKKISLWISTLFHPITASPAMDKPVFNSSLETVDELNVVRSVPWTISDQDTDTLVNSSPDLGRRPERKESLGGGIVVREQLIRDLE